MIQFEEDFFKSTKIREGGTLEKAQRKSYQEGEFRTNKRGIKYQKVGGKWKYVGKASGAESHISRSKAADKKKQSAVDKLVSAGWSKDGTRYASDAPSTVENKLKAAGLSVGPTGIQVKRDRAANLTKIIKVGDNQQSAVDKALGLAKEINPKLKPKSSKERNPAQEGIDASKRDAAIGTKINKITEDLKAINTELKESSEVVLLLPVIPYSESRKD